MDHFNGGISSFAITVQIRMALIYPSCVTNVMLYYVNEMNALQNTLISINDSEFKESAKELGFCKWAQMKIYRVGVSIYRNAYIMNF